MAFGGVRSNSSHAIVKSEKATPMISSLVTFVCAASMALCLSVEAGSFFHGRSASNVSAPTTQSDADAVSDDEEASPRGELDSR